MKPSIARVDHHVFSHWQSENAGAGRLRHHSCVLGWRDAGVAMPVSGGAEAKG
jgi:hypothetical protein